MNWLFLPTVSFLFRCQFFLITHILLSCLSAQNTALHLAAREGHAKAVRLLLDYGAKILFNKAVASFFHEAIHNRRKDVVSVIILHKR